MAKFPRRNRLAFPTFFERRARNISYQTVHISTKPTTTMSKTTRSLCQFVCRNCRQRGLADSRRQFTTATALGADEPPSNTKDDALGGLGGLGNTIARTGNIKRNFNRPQQSRNEPSYSEILNRDPSSFVTDEASRDLDAAYNARPHRLHIYAHKHNTHITLVQPTRSAAETTSSRIVGARVTSEQKSKMIDTLLSISTGNLGFRKAGRGSYDAAFQLISFTLRQMKEKGMMRDLRGLDVIFRGFGAGREAVTKALLGTEGKDIRQRITSVADATRLKQGGPRSRKPRRLG